MARRAGSGTTASGTTASPRDCAIQVAAEDAAESAASGEAAVWQIYDALSCQVLLMRGANSDLLDADTAREMTQRGPRAQLVEFEGVGHAPTLMATDQVRVVKEFLLA